MGAVAHRYSRNPSTKKEKRIIPFPVDNSLFLLLSPHRFPYMSGREYAGAICTMIAWIIADVSMFVEFHSGIVYAIIMAIFWIPILILITFGGGTLGIPSLISVIANILFISIILQDTELILDGVRNIVSVYCIIAILFSESETYISREILERIESMEENQNILDSSSTIEI